MKQEYVEERTNASFTILIVEDDEGLLNLIQKNLQRAGFHTAGVTNGAEAIARVVDNPATLLLLDYKLPDMTGKEVIASLERKRCAVPFITTTGHGDEKIAVEMMKLGARDYIVKDPAFLDLLPTVVKQVVEQLAVERKLAKAEEALDLQRKELISVFDSIDEAIYICDPESHEVLYVNAATKAIFGPDIVGKKCYRVFQGLDKPCDFCSNPMIFGENLEKPYVWELQNKVNGRWYRCIDKAIRWPDGRMVRCEMAIDIHDLKQAEEALRKSHDELELRVKERTVELVKANDELKREIEQRKRAEEVLRLRTHDLGELVKELNCLYGISHLVGKRGISLEGILQGTADLIPPSWQYSEITCARIIVEDQEFRTKDFRKTVWKQAADIIVHDERLGSVEVYYLEERPEGDEGPFTNEERSLINAIARRLGVIIERQRAEEALRESEKRLYDEQKRMEVLKFANDVALKLMHELRNPLTVIGGYSRRISSMECPADKLKEYTRAIFEQSMRLDNALNEALVHLKDPAKQAVVS